MATIDLNSAQLWTPSFNPFLNKQQNASSYSKARSVYKITSSQNQPALPYDKADRLFQCKNSFKSTTGPQHQGDGSAAGVQDRDNACANCDDKVDDFPSIEELWKQNSRQEISTEYQNSEDTLQHPEESLLDTSGSRLSPEQSRSNDNAGNSQGTRDKPVILEDDESHTPNLEAAAVSVLVDAYADPPFEPSTEPWYFVDEDLRPIPPLEQRGLASTSTSTSAQDQPRSPHYSPRSSQDQIKLHDINGITRIISDTTFESEDKDGGGWNSDDVAELERELQRSLDDKDKIESTGAPGSLHPSWSSIEPPHPQIDQEDDYSRAGDDGFEELSRDSPLYRQDQEEVQEQQQRQEAITELVRKEDDESDNEMRELQRENQQRQDRSKEINKDNHHRRGSNCSYTTADEEDDDEDPRPVKRQKLSSLPANNTLTPPDEPTPLGHNHCHPSCASRSPSATVESALAGEYQEWPFQGVLKRTRIGNETMYNLEFTLPPMQEHLHLPIHPAVLGTGFKEDLSAKATVSYQASTPRKPGKKLTEKQESLLAKLVRKDKTWAEIVEHFPGHTLQSLKENFFGKQGGKPRRRGRKPGVRMRCS